MNTHYSTFTYSRHSAPRHGHSVPTHAEVSECAYELWLQHGCPDDLDLAIWLDAETLLLAGGTHPHADYRELCRHK